MSDLLNKPFQNHISIELIEEDVKQGKCDLSSECHVCVGLNRLGFSSVEVMNDRLYVGNTTYWFDEEAKDYMKNKSTFLATLNAYRITPLKPEEKVKRKYTKHIKENNNEVSCNETVGQSIT